MNKRTLLNKFTSNWPAKVLSIALAILLYIFRQMSGMTDVRFDVPLVIRDNAEMTPAGEIPAKVKVSVHGIPQDTNLISADDLSASIDLSVYDAPGVYKVPINLKISGVTANVDSFDPRVVPPEITLLLDKRAGRYFNVEPTLRGEAAPGYDIVQKVVIPKQVYVEGPANKIAALKTIGTEVIDIAGRNENFTRNVRLSDVDPSLVVHEHTVQFTATIRSIDLTQEYTGISVDVVDLADNLSIANDTITGMVRVQGNEIFLQDWLPSANTLFIDCSQIQRQGNYTIPVAVNPPQELSVLYYEPQSVTITVRSSN